MYILKSCPHCGRVNVKGTDTNPDWFPVHTCREDLQRYCDECGEDDGKECPACGATNFHDYHRVYTNRSEKVEDI
jgi:hypothetical protein